MNRTSALTFTALSLLIFATVGCQPAPSRSSDLKIGRNGRGSSTGAKGGAIAGSNGATTWGQITGSSGDQAFDQILGQLVSPQLSGSNDPGLGFVSAAANQATGVIFWGQAAMVANSSNSSTATLQGANARLHIEIWDATSAQSGGAIQPFVIHIGSDQAGFVSAVGSSNGSSANLTFTDGYGSVMLQGQIANGYYSGTIAFSNASTGGTQLPLGQFQVPTCGFFTCQ